MLIATPEMFGKHGKPQLSQYLRKVKKMANCKSCTHSVDYLDPKDGLTKLICLSVHQKTMATVEGEHECVGLWRNWRKGNKEMDELTVAIKAVQMYAELHPRPSQVTQKQAAEMIGKSVPTVRKMVACGTFKLNDCGLIPIHQVDLAIAA
jgi:hypothetical protein